MSDKEEWVSLGVFGMVQGDEKDANKIFQLAINKDGVIRGNYYDALSDTESAVSGSVDKKTQRAAWVVGDRKDTVYETGIGNLTDPETTMLVHFGKDRTQQWTLVRLEPPRRTNEGTHKLCATRWHTTFLTLLLVLTCLVAHEPSCVRDFLRREAAARTVWPFGAEVGVNGGLAVARPARGVCSQRNHVSRPPSRTEM